MEFFQQYHIVIIACIFLGVIAMMTWLTYRDKKWVKKNYPKEAIIALGFGITCYGLSSEQGKPEKHKGFLLVHRGGLLFKSRFSDRLYDLPQESLQKVYHASVHKETKLHQTAVLVDFLTAEKNTDTIAFRVAYPAQWINIIGKSFLEDHA